MSTMIRGRHHNGVKNYAVGTIGAVLNDVCINVKMFPWLAKGDGDSNDTDAIQAAMNAVSARGGGIVWIPEGTYICENLNVKNKVKLKGTFGAVTLKARPGVDCSVILNTDAGTIVKEYIGFEGIIFDGDYTNQSRAGAAKSAADISGVLYFYAKDCIFKNATGYGLALQGRPGATSPLVTTQTDVYLENCHFVNNGYGPLPEGSNTFDGFDSKQCTKVTFVNCTASGNQDKGINIRGVSVTVVGGVSCNNVNAGYEFTSNPTDPNGNAGISVFGADAYGNGAAGFSIWAQTTVDMLTARVALTGITSRNNRYGVQVPSGADRVDLSVSDANIFSNTSDGVTVQNATAKITISNSIIKSNGRHGVYNGAGATILMSGGSVTANAEYGYREAVASKSVLDGALLITENVLGQILPQSTSNISIGSGVITYAVGSADVIASASTITIPETGSFFKITGTAAISDISSLYKSKGRVINLTFDNAATVQDGALKLAGTFTAANEATLSLIYNGTRWCEISRSFNS